MPMRDMLRPSAPIVRATFDRSDEYLRNNSTIPVRIELVRGLIKNLTFDRVADIGCGDGSVGLAVARDAKLTLVDLSSEMLARAKANTPASMQDRVEYHAVSIESFAPSASFDLVICLGVAAHVESLPALIQKVSALMAPNGCAVLQFTEEDSLYGRYVNRFEAQSHGGYRVNRVGQGSLFPMFQRAGLLVVGVESYSDSALGLGRISLATAVKFKGLTSRLGWRWLFSERIVLLSKRNER